MGKNFNKNDYKLNDKAYKVIIDTDPGVDDAVCLIYALSDENVDVRLLTTVVGNVDIEKTTRNLLHILDLFNKDIPVAKGLKRALDRISPDASFIHQKEGLGGYVPTFNSNRNVLDCDAVEAMYQVLIAGDGDIYPIILGPHTNIATLLQKHPDVIPKIPKITFMGGSPFGHPDYPDHISFNLSSDPEAFNIVLESKIPLLMLPSIIGRRKAHLSEEYVNGLKSVNDTGKLLYKMYSKYWEPKYSDKCVTTNDICTLFALIYPKLFTMEKVSVTVDTEKDLGKTIVDFNGTGHIDFVTAINREAFIEILNWDLRKFDKVKLPLAFDD